MIHINKCRLYEADNYQCSEVLLTNLPNEIWDQDSGVSIQTFEYCFMKLIPLDVLTLTNTNNMFHTGNCFYLNSIQLYWKQLVSAKLL